MNVTLVREDECLNVITKQSSSFLSANPNIPGVVTIILFYAAIFLVGILATWLATRKRKREKPGEKEGSKTLEDLVLAGRSMGTVLGTLTLAATEIGGGMLIGTAELMINPQRGLVWCQAPFFFVMALVIGGIFFASKMRRAGYRTMLDPFEERYGRVQTIFLYLSALLSDTLWSASILSALGATLSVIIGINYLWSVVLSAGVAVLYTFAGGLYSVAYTDVVELAFLFIGLWIAVPFAISHPAVESLSTTVLGNTTWLGQPVQGPSIGHYIDMTLLLAVGGVCWQPLYQRILAQKTAKKAAVISILGGTISYIVLIPVFLLGAVAASTDWNATGYRDIGQVPMPDCNYMLALPLVMRYLTPVPVAVIGLGAVAAAVMSSTDSAVLSSATMFALNFYAPLRSLRKGSKASNKELIWAMRLSVLVIGITATFISLYVPNTYGLLVFSGDFLYALFPHLVAVLYIPFSNSYGSFVAFWATIILRFLSGEPLINLPTIIKYPYYVEETDTQLFPYRLLIIIIAFFLMITMSLGTRALARKSQLFRNIDAKLFQCFVEKKSTPCNGHFNGILHKMPAYNEIPKNEIGGNGEKNSAFLNSCNGHIYESSI